MPAPPDLSFDVASVLYQGRRATQEDALKIDFDAGSGDGIVVLSDGMGGHMAGDVASRIVVSEVFDALSRLRAEGPVFHADLPGTLERAARHANACLRRHVETHPEAEGMGATLIAAVFHGGRLFWISIGDSPLFLLRDGTLRQINEDHSLAPQIDYMVETGLLSAEQGRAHPERNCLVSALAGGDIPHVDCPVDGSLLRPGDLVILATDGLQYLNDNQIEFLLRNGSGSGSEDHARLLLTAIKELDAPTQDNVGYVVVRVGEAAHERRAPGAVPGALARAAAHLPSFGGAARLPGLFSRVMSLKARF